MRKNINRREFIKLVGAYSLSALGLPLIQFRSPSGYSTGANAKTNILILVFDALSAHNMSLYGYDRLTTPNISRLADKAIVYHNHYASGNFTTPGTASLLTGVYPWKHRAFNVLDETDKDFKQKNVFHSFNHYHQVSYSHNPLAVKLLEQLAPEIDKVIPLEKFLLTNDNLVNDIFSNDEDAASVAWARTIKKKQGFSYSLFLSNLYQVYQKKSLLEIKSKFPRGMPSIREDNYFTLEMITEWLGGEIGNFPQPFLGYFHFLPPHYPYATHIRFYNRFLQDGFRFTPKPKDLFSEKIKPDLELSMRQQYDEFILYADDAFGKLFLQIEQAGMLDNTWVIMTSDHGEMFERGIIGHTTQVLYEPVIRIPLMIFEPGRTERKDVLERTSAVDVLPTLLSLTGGKPPEWSEGNVLPPFSLQSSSRDIFSVQAEGNKPNAPIKDVTIALMRDQFKLVYFTGYSDLLGRDRIEFYDLTADPYELNNLYSPESDIAQDMLKTIKTKLSTQNTTYKS